MESTNLNLKKQLLIRYKNLKNFRKIKNYKNIINQN